MHVSHYHNVVYFVVEMMWNNVDIQAYSKEVKGIIFLVEPGGI